MENYKAQSMELEEGKSYVPVHERILEFRSKYPFGGITPCPMTDVTKLENGSVIVFKAVAFRYPGDPNPGIGHAQSVNGQDYFKTSAMEIAETSAIGRALANLGIGIGLGIASADEVNKSKTVVKTKPKEVVEEKKVEEKKTVSPEAEQKENELVTSFSASIELADSPAMLKEIGKAIKDSHLSEKNTNKLREEFNAKKSSFNKKEAK